MIIAVNGMRKITMGSDKQNGCSYNNQVSANLKSIGNERVLNCAVKLCQIISDNRLNHY
jgi:hypothetical protein